MSSVKWRLFLPALNEYNNWLAPSSSGQNFTFFLRMHCNVLRVTSHWYFHNLHYKPTVELWSFASVTWLIKYDKSFDNWYLYRNTINDVTWHWRHNDRGGVSDHQPHDCLLSRLFRLRSKKTSKLRGTGLCAGNSPGPVNSPRKGPVTRKIFPFDDVIMR